MKNIYCITSTTEETEPIIVDKYGDYVLCFAFVFSILWGLSIVNSLSYTTSLLIASGAGGLAVLVRKIVWVDNS